MFKSVIFGAPKNCPNRNCRAKFYRDSHKGYLPKSELEVYTIMRCPVCRDTFMVTQMLHMVHDYKLDLPERTLPKNKVEIFTTDDQEEFRRQLYEDDNPLNNLYNGYVPGSTDTPKD